MNDEEKVRAEAMLLALAKEIDGLGDELDSGEYHAGLADAVKHIHAFISSFLHTEPKEDKP
jgi:hypothetical protein